MNVAMPGTLPEAATGDNPRLGRDDGAGPDCRQGEETGTEMTPRWRLTLHQPGPNNNVTMRHVGSRTRRWLSASLGLTLAGGGIAALAGEKVTFSNSDRRPNAPATDPRKAKVNGTRSIENPFESFGRGSSSLEGVTAPPFAPSAPTPEPQAPLTDKERRLLDQRQNWILRSADDYQRDQNDANRAFGVEQFDDKGGTRRPEASKGKLVDYYERLSKSQEAGAQAVPEALRNSGLSGRTGGSLDSRTGRRDPGASQPDGSLAPMRATGFAGDRTDLSFEAAFSEPESGARFGEERLGDNRLGADRQGDDSPEWLRTALGQSGALSLGGPATTPLSSPGGIAGEELRGVSRILGSSPIGNPLSSLDPVTAYPDPTREILNPVVGRPVGASLRPAAPGALAGPDQLGRSLPLGGASSVLDGGPGLAQQSGLGKVLDASAPERRSLHSIKVNLEMPKRSF
jgi:hypothetical protein